MYNINIIYVIPGANYLLLVICNIYSIYNTSNI